LILHVDVLICWIYSISNKGKDNGNLILNFFLNVILHLIIKGKLLFETKCKEDAKRDAGVVPDGDHVYYVAHKTS
jgi:hypothetical protein